MKVFLLLITLLIISTGYTQSKRQFAVINNSGMIIQQFEARWASAFYNGVARVKKKVVVGRQAFYNYGFIDSRGDEIIPFVYEDAKEFKGKSTWVKERGTSKYIQINRKGIRMNELEFDKISTFQDGVWKVRLESGKLTYGGRPMYLDGYVTDEGQLIVDPALGYFGAAFSNGFLCVGHDDKGYGFVDKEGNIAIPFEKRQDGFTSFYGGLARRINSDGKIGIINAQNKWIAAPTNLSMSGFDFRDSIITIIYNARSRSDFGYTDFNYKPLFATRFDDGHSFEHGYAEVKRGEKWGIINKKGAVVLPMKYDAVYNESDENYFMAYNEQEDGTTDWFYFDLQGNPLSKVEAFVNRPHRHGVFAVQAGKDEVYLYNEEGEKVHDIPFKRIQNTLEFADNESTHYDFCEEGVAMVQLLDGKLYPTAKH